MDVHEKVVTRQGAFRRGLNRLMEEKSIIGVMSWWQDATCLYDSLRDSLKPKH